VEKREDVLIPIDEQNVDFYGDEITAVLVSIENNTQMYIPLRPICDYLGLSWSGQYERVMRDPILSQEVRLIRLDPRQRRGNPILLCLPLELLHGWLFGIMASRVKPQIIPKLICYHKECFSVLWRAFQSGIHNINSNAITELGWRKGLLCSYRQVKEQVQAQLLRAEQLGLPSSLTIKQWVCTLEYFHGCCAYCGNRPGIVLEHFIPLTSGGGTTVGNCVPSCYSCNSKKGDKHPDSVTKIERDTLDKIKKRLLFLESIA